MLYIYSGLDDYITYRQDKNGYKAPKELEIMKSIRHRSSYLFFSRMLYTMYASSKRGCDKIVKRQGQSSFFVAHAHYNSY